MSTTLSATSTSASVAPITAAGPLTLIGRVLISVMFILAGISKLGGLEGTAGYIASVGLPFAYPAAVASGLFELVAGVLLLVGFQTRIVAALIAAFTVVASALFHNFWGAPPEAAMIQQLMFMKNIALVGGLLFIVTFGAGPLSVDAKRA